MSAADNIGVARAAAAELVDALASAVAGEPELERLADVNSEAARMLGIAGFVLGQACAAGASRDHLRAWFALQMRQLEALGAGA